MVVANSRQKVAMLTEILVDLRSALVAYSGGVDSAYLAWAARHRCALSPGCVY